MKIIEIKSKSILTLSKLGSFTLNPYIGCQHACLYCYATYIGKWKNPEKAWGTWVFVKINAPEILEKELQKYPPSSVFISTVCDAYQPVEKRYQITRRCLERFIQYPSWQISLLTKSDLVLRDLDLFKKIPQIEIGFSITTTDDNLAKIFEPYSSRPSKRIEALKKLKKEGVKTRVAINPILPYFTDPKEALKKMVLTFSKIGVDGLGFDKMNYLDGRVGKRLRPIYAKFGQKALNWLEYAKTQEYGEALRLEIEKVTKDINIPYQIYF